jgi:hypothetical protein
VVNYDNDISLRPTITHKRSGQSHRVMGWLEIPLSDLLDPLSDVLDLNLSHLTGDRGVKRVRQRDEERREEEVNLTEHSVGHFHRSKRDRDGVHPWRSSERPLTHPVTMILISQRKRG